jgi:hypothetical protein
LPKSSLSEKFVGFGGHRREKSCVCFPKWSSKNYSRKIKRLPQDRVAELENSVDSLARREQSRNRINLHQALTDYAIQHAGTAADIDPDLETTATHHLISGYPTSALPFNLIKQLDEIALAFVFDAKRSKVVVKLSPAVQAIQ